jgi:phosphate transport system substrate-binding protein
MKTTKKEIVIRKIIVLLLSFGFIFCSYAEETDNGQNSIHGINFENYPYVDGSTSTKPLNALVACKLLNIRYEWKSNIVGEWSVELNQEDIPEDFYGERIKASTTHLAFMNLIDGHADIILTHRTISPDEKAHADESGVTLIETSIAIDAFVFLVNKNNPVENLTVNQVQRIYTGEITNWQQVGGNDLAITPFTRPRNSGSEEIMRSLVMGDLEMANFPESSEIVTMAGVFPEVRDHPSGFCYTFNFYKDVMVRVPDSDVPKIAIEDVFPDANTVKNGTYPFIAEVHVAIRSDLDPNSMAYKMYEWLQTEGANGVISESGYIPKNTANSAIPQTKAENVQIYPNPVFDGFYTNGLTLPSQLAVHDVSGRKVLSQEVSDRKYIHIGHLPAGVYFVSVAGKVSKIVKR